jgi:hypothetical protein
MNRDSLSFASSGANTAIAAVASTPIQVYSLVLTLASSTTVQLKSGSTALTGAMTGTSFVFDFRPQARGGNVPWFVTAPGDAFVVTLGSAVQCSGQVTYGTGQVEQYS